MIFGVQNATDIRWFPLAKFSIFSEFEVNFFPFYKNEKKIMKINKLRKLNNNANKIRAIDFFPSQSDNLRKFHYKGLGFPQGLSNEIIISAVCCREMSHNSKYYRQKIKKKDVEGVSKISSFFKPNTNVGDDEKCENPTESQIIEMPHRSSEEKIKAVTSSMEEPMQASASRIFLLQQFQTQREDTKVAFLDTVTLQSFDQRKFSAQ